MSVPFTRMSAYVQADRTSFKWRCPIHVFRYFADGRERFRTGTRAMHHHQLLVTFFCGRMAHQPGVIL